MAHGLKKNTAFYFIQFAAQALTNLAVTPLIVVAVGSEGLGLLRAVQRIIDISACFDGRVGQVLKTTLARLHAGDDSMKDREIPKADLVSYGRGVLVRRLLVSLVVAIPCIIGIGLMGDLTNESEQLQYLTLALMLLVSMIMSSAAAVDEAVFVAEGRSFISSQIYLLGGLLAGFGTAMYCWQYEGQSLGMLGVPIVVGSLFTAVIMHQKSGNYLTVPRRFIDWAPSRLPMALARRFKVFSSNTVGWAVVEKLTVFAEFILVFALLGKEKAGVLSVIQFAPQVMVAASLLATSAYLPVMARLHAEKKDLAILEFRRAVRTRAVAIGLCGASAVAAGNVYFVRQWVGDLDSNSYAVSFALALLALQFIVMRAEVQIMESSGLIAGRIPAFLVPNILAFMVSYAGVQHASWELLHILLCLCSFRLLLPLILFTLSSRQYGMKNDSRVMSLGICSSAAALALAVLLSATP